MVPALRDGHRSSPRNRHTISVVYAAKYLDLAHLSSSIVFLPIIMVFVSVVPVKSRCSFGSSIHSHLNKVATDEPVSFLSQ